MSAPTWRWSCARRWTRWSRRPTRSATGPGSWADQPKPPRPRGAASRLRGGARVALLAQAFVRVRPDFAGFGAMLKAELEKQAASAAGIGNRIGVEISRGLRQSLGHIKQDLANVGVADLFDINVPYGKLY